jgi:ribose/xylose/arabinose/galactoside ABC-type transport system permease subunit
MPSIAALGPFLALALACAFFASQTDRFLSGQNFSLILQQVMVVGSSPSAKRSSSSLLASTCRAG